MKQTHETPEQRNASILSYLTILYNRTKTPNSTKKAFESRKTKILDDGTVRKISLTEEVGIANSYPIRLLVDMGVWKIVGDEDKRSPIVQWIGTAPTLKTVYRLEKGRKKIKRKNYDKNRGAERIIKNLGDTIIDNYIKKYRKEFRGYGPRDTTLESIHILLKTFEYNTLQDYRDKAGQFLTMKLNPNSGKYDAVDMSEELTYDTRFTQNFRRAWGIEEVHPTNLGLSRYSGDAPVTLDFIKKVQFVLNNEREVAKAEAARVEAAKLAKKTKVETPPVEPEVVITDYGKKYPEFQKILEEICVERKKLQKEREKWDKKVLEVNELYEKIHNENLEQSIGLKETFERLITATLEVTKK